MGGGGAYGEVKYSVIDGVIVCTATVNERKNRSKVVQFIGDEVDEMYKQSKSVS